MNSMAKIWIVLLFSPTLASANFQSDLLNAKRAKKESSQWTIGDWLSQKSKIAFWDQWLAMNRQATTYESYLSASHSRFTQKNTDASGISAEVDGDSQNYSIDLYITIFNIFGEYERTNGNREVYGGGIGLRLFGTSSQSTNLALKGGWRKTSDLRTPETWENTFAEGALQLYLLKFMGLQGKYRLLFPAKSDRENTMQGTRVTGGVFFEMSIFRIFADYYQEPLQYKDANGVITKQQREGYDAGIKFYF